MKIIIKNNEGNKAGYDFGHDEVTVGEMYNAFFGLMITMGYTKEGIENIIIEKADLLLMEENKELLTELSKKRRKRWRAE